MHLGRNKKKSVPQRVISIVIHTVTPGRDLCCAISTLPVATGNHEYDDARYACTMFLFMTNIVNRLSMMRVFC
jgi:hypothetical protein